MESNLIDALDNNLRPHDGALFYTPDVFMPAESQKIYSNLLSEVPWVHKQIRMFGKMVWEPRLTAWMGDESAIYTYSGVRQIPRPFTASVQQLKERVEVLTGAAYNSALLNYYRNGADSMGWHRDNEKELGPMPTIASLSFGAARKFKVRDYLNKQPNFTLELAPGSLLLMTGTMQTHWEHALPKTTTCHAGRINITFRWVQGG